MAEYKRGGLGGRRRLPLANRDNSPEGPALNTVGAAQAFGRAVDAPRGPNGERLVDSLNEPLQDATFYGSGRQKQQFGTGTTRLPLVGPVYAQVRASAQGLTGIPSGNQYYISVDNQTGELPAGLGSDAHSNALASGTTDAGVAYVGRVKVGSQTYANKIKQGFWDRDTEAGAVALGMALGGREQAENLQRAGYDVKFDALGVLERYTKGNPSAVRALGVMSGSKRLIGTYGFALRANQQAGYWDGGDSPQGRAQLAQRLATDRDGEGFVSTPGAFPLNKRAIRKVPGKRGYRTGIVFTPRTADGRPIPIGYQNMMDKDYQCRVENSGPGISDFTDADGKQSAGFRLFPRRNKKSGSVSCGYSPDIFVNTLTSSYAQGGRRVMANNDLRTELERRGAAAVGQGLDRGYAELTQNRGAFYGRSLKRRPVGAGNISDSQDKVQAWMDRQGL